MACLDTTTLLDLSGRSGRAVRERARRKIIALHAAGQVLATTRFNVAELWVGVVRSPTPQKEQVAVSKLLEPLVVLEFDAAGARVFGRLTAYLQVQGRPAGDMDVLIASVALVNGQSLITRNPKHLADIPALVVESY